MGRIKWNKYDENNKILIATMRDHFNIIQFNQNKQKLEKLYCYTAHFDDYQQRDKDIDILAYGCDWSVNNFIATCSFYDKQFQCWQY